jgi:hypothetical protein
MTQNMRRHVRRQIAKLGDARPKSWEAGHPAIATGRREYQLAGFQVRFSFGSSSGSF